MKNQMKKPKEKPNEKTKGKNQRKQPKENTKGKTTLRTRPCNVATVFAHFPFEPDTLNTESVYFRAIPYAEVLV